MYRKIIKRVIDFILSLVGLTILSPVFIILCIWIKCDSIGPILFKQKRVGIHKTYFNILKFRTMYIETPSDMPTHMLKNPDQFITKSGKFLRKTSLDELPQIINILKGEMSIIGPRPALWNQEDLIEERDKYQANDVKPGLTGWAQINGRDELEIEVKAKLDGDYVKHMSFLFDVKCFIGTVTSVLKHDGVVEGGTGIKEEKGSIGDRIEKEKFSVLMSVYSKENPAFFKQAIESNINNQTRCPDEFVLICDGPLTSELEKTIELFQKKNNDSFKVYRLNENVGLGKALNYGLEKCSYDIVARSDSDDICDNNRFEKQVSFLEKNKNITLISSFIDEFETDFRKPKSVKKMPITNEQIYKMAKFRNPINHMAVVFRKNDIIAAGSYQHAPYIEDYDLWVRLLVNGYKLSNMDEVLVHARVGNGMVKRRSNKEYISSWERLSTYMLENHMINRIQFFRNMLLISIFIYIPSELKTFVYRKFLRN